MSVERKKILVFADWFVPGFRAGGPIRSLVNLVASLPEFNFFIVTRNTDHHSSQPYPGIETGRWIQHLPHVQVMYLEEGNLNKHAFAQIIDEQPYDCYYLNSLFSKSFALLPLRMLRMRNLEDKILLAPRGMLNPGALGVKRWKKKVFLTAAKQFGWYKKISWHATSDAESAEIKKHFGEVTVKLAPNLSAPAQVEIRRPEKNTGELKLVSIARISPEKGISEAIQFLENARLTGNVTLDFYGTEQNQIYLTMCKSLAEAASNIKVSFNGEISPDKIPKALASAHFFYSATLGENHGHAIVEALANSVPVIITNRTPWRNLESKLAGWDLPLDEQYFASILKKCVDMDNETYRLWCAGAGQLGNEITHDNAAIDASRLLFVS